MAGDVESRIEEAVAKLDSGTRLLVRREIEKLPGLLSDGEEIAHMAHGRHGEAQGLIVTTDRRFLFVEEGLVRGELQDLPYESISSVDAQVGVVHSMLTIVSGENEVVIDRVYPKDRTMKIAEFVRSRVPGASGHRLGHQPEAPEQQPEAEG